MTASELLTLLGLAWWRLLVYPGGLALLAAVWLAARAMRHLPRIDASAPQQTPGVQPSFYMGIIAPWLATALLPLPGTRPLNRPLDIFVTLALLDAPLFVAVAASLRSAGAEWLPGARRLVALNGYPTLLLAFALLSGGAQTLDALAQPPDTSDLRTTAAHWFGAVTLLLALPAMLNLGPFAMQQAPAHDQKLTFALHVFNPWLVAANDWPDAARRAALAGSPWRAILARTAAAAADRAATMGISSPRKAWDTKALGLGLRRAHDRSIIGAVRP